MNKNKFKTIAIAGLSVVAGMTGVANAAVSINNDGLGQLLVFPYYTVNNDLQTLISVVNVTDETKAVKVRILEGKNSRNVLDFNLYLSPYDVWTGALTATTATNAPLGILGGEAFAQYHDTPSGKLKTGDASCTAPLVMNNQEFKPFAFDNDGVDDVAIADSMERSREGHLEMIEMGIVVNGDDGDNYADWIEHTTAGYPFDCPSINQLWFDPDPSTADIWHDDVPQGTTNVIAPSGFGGLYGTAAIVDVFNGFEVSYNADAIQGFSVEINHTRPGEILPSIASHSPDNTNALFPYDSIILVGNDSIETSWKTSIESVSALFMRDKIYNEYVISDLLGANTEWVVTFPTKKYYVDPEVTQFASVPYEPFTTEITTDGACETASREYWNREEAQPIVNIVTCPAGTLPYITPTDPPQVICITPGVLPPEGTLFEPPVPSLCWGTNVVEFSIDEDQLSSDIPSVMLGSTSKFGYFIDEDETDTDIDTDFTTGWVDMTFAQFTDTGVELAAPNAAVTYTGLPVTGFAVQRLVFSAAFSPDIEEDKVYGTIFKHKSNRNITVTTD